MCAQLDPLTALRGEQRPSFTSVTHQKALISKKATKRSTHVDHTVSVGMDVDTLKQLDNLRRAHPTIPSRTEVIKRLIWDAHAKIPQ